MKRHLAAYILALILIRSVAGGPEGEIIAAWNDRPSFSADIVVTKYSPIDTVSEKGKIAIRRPDAVYRTETEFALFTAGTLYSFSYGSDVGIKNALDDYIYSDIAALIGQLGDDFKLDFERTDSNIIMTGSEGNGNVRSFRAVLNNDYLPASVTYKDIFGYETKFAFSAISLSNPEDAFGVPAKVEFIEP